jgi:hypothetical protein
MAPQRGVSAETKVETKGLTLGFGRVFRAVEHNRREVYPEEI